MSRRKRAKANLPVLVQAGLLREGQILHLMDYQNNPFPNSEARVVGNRLLRGGQVYSMSALAVQLLQQRGYSGDSVRGPQFWYTEQNESVHTLWEQYLSRPATA